MDPLKWRAKEKARKAEIKRCEDLATAKAVRERFLPPPSATELHERILAEMAKANFEGQLHMAEISAKLSLQAQGTRTGRYKHVVATDHVPSRSHNIWDHYAKLVLSRRKKS